jgi:hypothetical protein
MLRAWQVAMCGCLAIAFWIVATLYIRLLPSSLLDPLQGTLGFALGIPIGWLCIRLTCRVARLAPSQILPGCMVVLACTTLIDGAALRWFPTLYASDEHTGRLAAAWLLWGYGVTAALVVVVAGRRQPEAL